MANLIVKWQNFHRKPFDRDKISKVCEGNFLGHLFMGGNIVNGARHSDMWLKFGMICVPQPVVIANGQSWANDKRLDAS